MGLLLLLPFVACDSASETYPSADAVAAAMQDEDINCEGLETTTEFSDATAEHESLVKERGVCTVDGETTVITLFENAEDRDDWVAVGRLLGSVAIGPNWVVSSRSEQVVDEIAQALDASRPEEEEG